MAGVAKSCTEYVVLLRIVIYLLYRWQSCGGLRQPHGGSGVGVARSGKE